ncbi:MAG: hypothetical protein NTV52_12190 [Acidobacteria bacterium]|nr:hypothetical protein [Acidobacteriota bacterium]
MQILEDAGYWYSFERELYINRSERKAFSVEFIEDSSEEQLRAALATPAPLAGDWDFKFNTAPSPSVKRQLVAILS